MYTKLKLHPQVNMWALHSYLFLIIPTLFLITKVNITIIAVIAMAPTASSAHTAPTIDGVRLAVEECGGDVSIVVLEGLITCVQITPAV